MGDAGVLVAISLATRFDVTGVSTRPALVSGQELGNRLADPDRWRANFLLPFDRFRRLDRVRQLHGRILEVDLEGKRVKVERAMGGEVWLTYDQLVIATGVSNGFWRHDRVEDLDAIEAGIRTIDDELLAARTVAIVGGGPTGVSAAVGLARRDPGKEVHLYFAPELPLAGYHHRTRERIERELRTAGVHLHPGHRAKVPDGFEGDRLTHEPVEWTTGQDATATDVVLWATGKVRPHTGCLPDELLDEDGFVRVDEHLAAPGRPGVWAVGDVAASDPARSSARNWGFLVVAANVKALAAGRSDRFKRFKAPEHRWGSILGVQDDGLLVFQPDGRAVRVPKGVVQPVLFDLYLHRGLYRGLRRRA